MTVIEFLKEEKINSSLIEGIMEFRASHPVREEDRGREAGKGEDKEWGSRK